ncbi:hypothetical protein CFIO01_02298 [Colletotrichum fioriniae PJ7]|uniref:Uncharacterized protein n=1 Tax=Colletotrichum fioriniae PJ7 TaxID=1445577 RepID=A0A010S645_9PEZI|nr:hypothetical protein CFIO01_02298 [Colletotrichum fioriniae PJ7]
MGETIRGAGLLKADLMLATIAENPDRLENERRRFAMSVQSNSSQSQNSTRSQSSEPANDDKQRQEQELWRVREQYYASSPFRQFEVQKEAELLRLLKAEEESTMTQPAGVDFHQLADDNVRERWKLQGIWNQRWGTTKEAWKWKHEDSGPTTKATATAVGTGLFRRPYTRSMKTLKTMRQSTTEEERSKSCDSDRDASRPFNQFIHQMFEEYKRTRSFNESNVFGDEPDIYTRIYEAIRAAWIERGIWDVRWGMLPGLSWKHEESLDNVLNRESGGKSDTPRPAVPALSDHVALGGSSSCVSVGLVLDNNKPPADLAASSRFTGATRLHRRTELLEPNVRRSLEARQANPLRWNDSLRRQHVEKEKPDGYQLFALDVSRNERFKTIAQRRQQKADRRREASTRAAGQHGRDDLPYIARLRPRIARGRAQLASRIEGSS